jgi:hypothetical protein
MPKKDLTPQQKWDKKHPEVIKKSKAEYEKRNPKWQFRPDEEMRKWLEEARGKDEKRQPESNAAVVIRKLKKLMKIEKENLNQ